MPHRRTVLTAAAASILLVNLLGASGHSHPDAYQQGLALYQQKRYKAAAEAFERSLRTCPHDANVSYYLAVSCQKCGRVKRAHQLFKHVVTSFPDTNAARLAQAFLQEQSKPEKGTIKGATSSQSKAPRLNDSDSTPVQEKIGFERRGERLFIKAHINDRPVQMCFDTGAPSTFISVAALSALNLPVPSGPPTLMVAGPTGDPIPTWETAVNVKVGNITRARFPIFVMDNAGKSIDDAPALGQSFFSQFHYTIDEQSKTIQFTKIGAEGGSSGITTSTTDPWSVPFSWQGRQMVVQVEVNGRPVSMLFDAGAYYIAFNQRTLHNLNIQFPSETPTDAPATDGAAPVGSEFEVESMRLGPITKRNIHVVAMSDSALRTPLLGQPFFGDYQYTIDNEHGLIHFLKK